MATVSEAAEDSGNVVLTIVGVRQTSEPCVDVMLNRTDGIRVHLMDMHTTVATVIDILEATSSKQYDPTRHTLIFAGQPLDPLKSLSYYGISAGATLTVVSRISGDVD